MKTKHKVSALVLSLIFILGCFTACLTEAFQAFNDGGIESFAESLYPLTEEEVEEFSPKNQQQASYIDTMPRHPDNEEWVLFIYMCGSNLESQGRYALSRTLEAEQRLAAFNKRQEEGESLSNRFQYFQDFTQVQKANNLSLPESFYEKILPPEETDNEKASELLDKLGLTLRGVASTDLMHITNVQLPENITFIIQTGGANYWDYPGINPNLTQRWKYDHTGLSEIYSGPAENMGSPEGLTNFLEFTKSYYSDHNAFIFWNHGGGAFGAEHDEIFDDMLSNREIRECFENTYPVDVDNPPFELLGFDACLMSSTEACNEFAGIGKYYVASEEIETDGWKNSKWVQDFANNPNWNGAQLGKAIVDSFMEKASQLSSLMKKTLVTNQLSLLDLSKTKDIYEAYGQLINKALKDSLTNPTVLTQFATASQRSIRYAGDVYDVYNTCDLGLFLDGIADAYPEAKEIRAMIDESLLYQRGVGQNSFSTGLSIYFPTEITDLAALLYALEYIEEISTEPAVQAFYYYKIAGCLSEEHQEYVESQGWGRAPVINTAHLKEFSTSPIEVHPNGSITMEISQDKLNFVQKTSLLLIKYDKDSNSMIYYGEDDFTHYNDGKLTTTFDGSWPTINDSHLALEVISSDDKFIRYESPIRIKKDDKILLLTYDRATKETSITGIRSAVAPDVISRQVTILKKGAKITPLYKSTTGVWADETTVKGKAIKFDPEKVTVGEKPLEDGIYIQCIQLQDFKGNTYVSPLVEFEMDNGKVKNAAVSEDYRTFN